MKKSVYLVLLLALSMGYYACTSSSASKPIKTAIVPGEKVNIATLEDIGFSNSVSITEIKTSEARQHYAEMGFKYLSQQEVQVILFDNNFIVGAADRYTADIPKQAAIEITSNYNKIKNKGLISDAVYHCRDGRQFTQKVIDDMQPNDRAWAYANSTKDQTVMVIGPESKFNTTDMEITAGQLRPKSKDPIVIVTVSDGYLELARW